MFCFLNFWFLIFNFQTGVKNVCGSAKNPMGLLLFFGIKLPVKIDIILQTGVKDVRGGTKNPIDLFSHFSELDYLCKLTFCFEMF